MDNTLDDYNKNFNPKFNEYSISMVFSFYILILIFSFISLIKITSLAIDDISILTTLYGIISTSSLGSSLYYIRKLYKLCLGKNITLLSKGLQKNNQDFILEQIGTFIYFITRPIYGISFSCIIFLGLNCGLLSISNNLNELNTATIYFYMFISFFIGFSSGSFLSSMHDKSDSITSILWNIKK